MGQWEIRPRAYENLLNHLVTIEENRSQWVHDHFPQLSPERDQLVNLLDQYIQELDAFLRNAKQSEQCSDELPFVIMGSEVEALNLENGKRQVFTILPFYEERVKNHHISILSPMGKSLLLKTKGAVVTINAPRGNINWEIINIKYPDS